MKGKDGGFVKIPMKTETFSFLDIFETVDASARRGEGKMRSRRDKKRKDTVRR